MTPQELLEKLTQIEMDLSEGPWTLECVRGAIRHVYRNMDHEQYCGCETEERLTPGMYDGSAIAVLRNLLPDIREHVGRLAK